MEIRKKKTQDRIWYWILPTWYEMSENHFNDPTVLNCSVISLLLVWALEYGSNCNNRVFEKPKNTNFLKKFLQSVKHVDARSN